MLTERQKKLIREIPKAENHIHIEGSIPWDLALELAKKNKVELPHKTLEEMKAWTTQMLAENGLDGFMACDRTYNSVCLYEEDYEAVVMALAKEDARQNIVYQELHLDYPLNEERGIPIDVVMNGYRKAQLRAKEELGVEIVYIAGIDRTLPEEKCVDFVKALEPYRYMVAGLGMDCEERNHPCSDHIESYRIGKELGLFLTAHAGEEGDINNIWDALLKLNCQRIDHGCRAAESPELMNYLKEHDILLAMCPYGNTLSFAADDELENSPFKVLLRNGVPVSISSDDPPYTMPLTDELMMDMEKMKLTEEEIIRVIRNGFKYSISGQKYLPMFDKWVADFMENNKE